LLAIILALRMAPTTRDGLLQAGQGYGSEKKPRGPVRQFCRVGAFGVAAEVPRKDGPTLGGSRGCRGPKRYRETPRYSRSVLLLPSQPQARHRFGSRAPAGRVSSGLPATTLLEERRPGPRARGLVGLVLCPLFSSKFSSLA